MMTIVPAAVCDAAKSNGVGHVAGKGVRPGKSPKGGEIYIPPPLETLLYYPLSSVVGQHFFVVLYQVMRRTQPIQGMVHQKPRGALCRMRSSIGSL